ncbi:cytochrome bc complex cytochrome b subunit [Nostoc sp. FACHB-87]|uniref:cytochrome b N-terminal domain-containing protein n=1 Tax=Nostocales TaxID=1161 RepID=UPI001688D1C8|nr:MULTISPECIES: cytochrome b N-terminal domain-containing protein [Nostocales]MBD2297168.1 cytochrome bc complex cytochrome b subunit [Nostoc sp. FACHB-190]MBD2452993.1 cytochrome bc complex cytochrome b subunit [Nostoc sp. FACHB-87]MBD2474825.1 cytochrome bc complex cytochrome b subunit [Anabaena sp. FACHB-83]MBD2488166.1 cytochrome bc complex cytochrome b subunit [Aulosira sp. FACHB-615]
MQSTQFERILRRLATVLSVVILTLCLIYTTTGVLLSFYYEPTAGGAYNSLKMINTQVPYGWLFYRTHEIAGNGLIAIALVQIVVMFLGRQFSQSWLVAWVSGILLTLSAIGLDWTAMLLDWTQEGYWRFSIELGTIEAIPLIGGQLRNILTGGGAINTLTVEHLYTIHSYIVAVATLILAVVHLLALVWQEQQTYTAEVLNQLPETSLVES